MRLLENGCDSVWRTDDNHGIWVAGAHGIDSAADLRGLPLVGAYSDRFSVVGFQRGFHTFENGRPERVIGIDDADLFVAESVPQAVDLFAGFVEVGSTDVDNPMAERRVQCLSAGEQAHQRNLVAFRHGYILYGRGSTHKKA